MAAEPRWLDRTGVAAYLCVRVDALPRLQRRGKLPAPSYHLGARSPRWDRHALDSLLAGAASSVASDPATLGASVVQDILSAGGRKARARPQAR